MIVVLQLQNSKPVDDNSLHSVLGQSKAMDTREAAEEVERRQETGPDQAEQGDLSRHELQVKHNGHVRTERAWVDSQ